jgi:hypothetical protein
MVISLTLVRFSGGFPEDGGVPASSWHVWRLTSLKNYTSFSLFNNNILPFDFDT